MPVDDRRSSSRDDTHPAYSAVLTPRHSRASARSVIGSHARWVPCFIDGPAFCRTAHCACG